MARGVVVPAGAALVFGVAVVAACEPQLAPQYEVDMRAPAGLPFFEMELNGEPRRCLYDTGSSSLFLSERTSGLEPGGVVEEVVVEAVGVKLALVPAGVLPDDVFDALAAAGRSDLPVDCIVGGEVTAPLRVTL